MKITIIYDNTVFEDSLTADWGFSALVETRERKILFDTGASGAVLISNMEKLGVMPEDIDDVFISHPHYDHIGGLSAVLDRNNNLTVWVPHSFRGVKNAEKVVEVDSSRKMYEGIFSTGEINGIEQSLCIETKEGIIIIAGCSHPDIEDIINSASKFGNVCGIIGGLHANRPETLKDMKFICPTHCTQHKEEIKKLYPEKYIEGGAGQVIEIKDS